MRFIQDITGYYERSQQYNEKNAVTVVIVLDDRYLRHMMQILVIKIKE